MILARPESDWVSGRTVKQKETPEFAVISPSPRDSCLQLVVATRVRLRDAIPYALDLAQNLRHHPAHRVRGAVLGQLVRVDLARNVAVNLARFAHATTPRSRG